MAAPSFLFTIDRVAEMLGADVDDLEEIDLAMETEDRHITGWGPTINRRPHLPAMGVE